MNSQENDIVNQLMTTEEAKSFGSSLDSLTSALYRSKEEFDEILSQKISAKIAKTIREIYGKDSENKTTTKSFLSELKESLRKLKVFKITLAVDPTEKLINDIFSWVRENLGEGIILDIEKDRNILGGAVIVFEGKYKDYSLVRTLDQELEKEREEILTQVQKSNIKNQIQAKSSKTF